MRRFVPTATRRSFLVGAAGVLAAPMVAGPSRAAADSLTMVSYGGSYQDALVRTVTSPFTKETGIQVKFVNAPDLAKVKAMLLTGNVEWDIFEGSGTWLASGAKQGFWEKLEPAILELNDFAAPPTSDYATPQLFAQGITWDPTKYGPGKHPVTFTEFFDLRKFPGRRSMRPYPDGTLEIALLADGVAPKDMYPLDLDRAFKALERIKSNTVWPPASPQSVSLVQTGEVDFSITSSNRAKTTTDPGGGKPLAFSFDQNVLNTSSFAVIKGAPNKENAMKLIAYMLRPEVEARLADQVSTVPVSKKAASLLSVEARKWQPDLSNPNNLVVNSEYWAGNFEAVTSRFKAWVLS
ncbi:ABC transporter substrate-binding protein [Bradyrhizobium brasilense]|uniref:ABC transporter substrate-binding protein n=1 Tax=Bradyrhizobium brasilense TaxID=1419277 RepID=UPI002877AA79|nr:ABC transporter substrate-binding protein [Bradyrhizobium brasilense]MCP3419870.1 ABC transporter substrate-binding protein [Bradyrhizobium brasilense]